MILVNELKEIYVLEERLDRVHEDNDEDVSIFVPSLDGAKWEQIQSLLAASLHSLPEKYAEFLDRILRLLFSGSYAQGTEWRAMQRISEDTVPCGDIYNQWLAELCLKISTISDGELRERTTVLPWKWYFPRSSALDFGAISVEENHVDSFQNFEAQLRKLAGDFNTSLSNLTTKVAAEFRSFISSNDSPYLSIINDLPSDDLDKLLKITESFIQQLREDALILFISSSTELFRGTEGLYNKPLFFVDLDLNLNTNKIGFNQRFTRLSDRLLTFFRAELPLLTTPSQTLRELVGLEEKKKTQHFSKNALLAIDDLSMAIIQRCKEVCAEEKKLSAKYEKMYNDLKSCKGSGDFSKINVYNFKYAFGPVQQLAAKGTVFIRLNDLRKVFMDDMAIIIGEERLDSVVLGRESAPATEWQKMVNTDSEMTEELKTASDGWVDPQAKVHSLIVAQREATDGLISKFVKLYHELVPPPTTDIGCSAAAAADDVVENKSVCVDKQENTGNTDEKDAVQKPITNKVSKQKKNVRKNRSPYLCQEDYALLLTNHPYLQTEPSPGVYLRDLPLNTHVHLQSAMNILLAKRNVRGATESERKNEEEQVGIITQVIQQISSELREETARGVTNMPFLPPRIDTVLLGSFVFLLDSNEEFNDLLIQWRKRRYTNQNTSYLRDLEETMNEIAHATALPIQSELTPLDSALVDKSIATFPAVKKSTLEEAKVESLPSCVTSFDEPTQNRKHSNNRANSTSHKEKLQGSKTVSTQRYTQGTQRSPSIISPSKPSRPPTEPPSPELAPSSPAAPSSKPSRPPTEPPSPELIPSSSPAAPPRKISRSSATLVEPSLKDSPTHSVISTEPSQQWSTAEVTRDVDVTPDRAQTSYGLQNSKWKNAEPRCRTANATHMEPNSRIGDAVRPLCSTGSYEKSAVSMDVESVSESSTVRDPRHYYPAVEDSSSLDLCWADDQPAVVVIAAEARRLREKLRTLELEEQRPSTTRSLELDAQRQTTARKHELDTQRQVTTRSLELETQGQNASQSLELDTRRQANNPRRVEEEGQTTVQQTVVTPKRGRSEATLGGSEPMKKRSVLLEAAKKKEAAKNPQGSFFGTILPAMTNLKKQSTPPSAASGSRGESGPACRRPVSGTRSSHIKSKSAWDDKKVLRSNMYQTVLKEQQETHSRLGAASQEHLLQSSTSAKPSPPTTSRGKSTDAFSRTAYLSTTKKQLTSKKVIVFHPTDSLLDIYHRACKELGSRPSSNLIRLFPSEPNEYITKLDLSISYIGLKGMLPVYYVLENNKSHLQQLNVSSNNLKNSDLLELLEVLSGESGKNLLELDISYNPITEMGGMAIVSHLPSLPSLKKMLLMGTLISTEACESITETLKSR